MSNQVVYTGTGRRKSSVARVRLIPGNGQITVNDKSGFDYFQQIQSYIQALKSPLETLGLENEYNIIVRAHGGGLTGQSDAIKLGVARALCELDPENRKKYGLRKARKAPQYSKR